MKIAFFVCSNGFGHFHRTIQVCRYLPDTFSVDVYCEEYQHLKFLESLDYSDNLNFIFYKVPNIRWDSVIKTNTFDFLAYQKFILPYANSINDYDVVISDNIVELLAYRSDTIISGSFLWSDVFKRKLGNNELTKRDEQLIREHKPLIICNKYVSMGNLKDYDNKLEIGWGCEDEGKEDYELRKIVCISPSLGYSKSYHKKFKEISKKYSKSYEVSDSITDVENSVFVIRPGLGMITTCIKYRIPIIAVWDENDSLEIKHLAQKVEEFGIGKAYNVKDDIGIWNNEQAKKIRENFKKFDLSGYKKTADYLMELS